MIVRVWAAGLLAALVVAQTPWTELRGEGFVLRGALPVETLSAVACDLDAAVRAVGHPKAATVPTVVAVHNTNDVREWLPRFRERGAGNPLGAYWQGLYGHHIVVRVDARPAERLRRVLHEYAHFVTHLAHPEPPRWLDEGLSEVWEHAAITTGAIEVGRPVADHVKRLRAGKDWLPVQEVLSANEIPTTHGSAAAMFYAQSWALMHYLLFEKAGGTVVLDRLPDPADVPTDEQLKAYVLGQMAGGVTISRAAGAGTGCSGQAGKAGAVREVPHLEALISRAQALADGDRPDTAVAVLSEAIGLDPDNVEATETLGFVHFRGNRPVEAAAVFDGLIAAGQGSHITYYYRAVLATPVPDLTGGGGPVPEVAYLKKALALKPGFAPALERLRELTGQKRTEKALANPPQTVRQ